MASADDFDPRYWGLKNLPDEPLQKLKVLQRYPVKKMGQIQCMTELELYDPLIDVEEDGNTRSRHAKYFGDRWLEEDGSVPTTTKFKWRRPPYASGATVKQWRAWLRKAREDSELPWKQAYPQEENKKKDNRQSFAGGNEEEEEEEDEELSKENAKEQLKKWNITMWATMVWVAVKPGAPCAALALAHCPVCCL